MLEEMKSLGWDEKYYPKPDDMDRQTWKTWSRMLSQPTRFTRQGRLPSIPVESDVDAFCRLEPDVSQAGGDLFEMQEGVSSGEAADGHVWTASAVV